ncbi:hypothetical protein, partial [Saccharomonospora halophila]|uniref:hypothetical protein n=1 Tax=Saccharomonospora halophila TaxID=129922 RepID=UPI001E453B3C
MTAENLISDTECVGRKKPFSGIDVGTRAARCTRAAVISGPGCPRRHRVPAASFPEGRQAVEQA